MKQSLTVFNDQLAWFQPLKEWGWGDAWGEYEDNDCVKKCGCLMLGNFDKIIKWQEYFHGLSCSNTISITCKEYIHSQVQVVHINFATIMITIIKVPQYTTSFLGYFLIEQLYC